MMEKWRVIRAVLICGLVALAWYAWAASNDLSTMDPTRPLGTDLASTWDDYMRETRSKLLISFGLDHYLQGGHKTGFLQSAHFSTGAIPGYAYGPASIPEGAYGTNSIPWFAFGSNSIPWFAFASNSIPVSSLMTSNGANLSPMFCITNASLSATLAGLEPSNTLLTVALPAGARWVFVKADKLVVSGFAAVVWFNDKKMCSGTGATNFVVPFYTGTMAGSYTVWASNASSPSQTVALTNFTLWVAF